MKVPSAMDCGMIREPGTWWLEARGPSVGGVGIVLIDILWERRHDERQLLKHALSVNPQ